MNWEQKAVKACQNKGLEVVPDGFEGGWVFVEDKDANIFPVGEGVVAKWIDGDAQSICGFRYTFYVTLSEQGEEMELETLEVIKCGSCNKKLTLTSEIEYSFVIYFKHN